MYLTFFFFPVTFFSFAVDVVGAFGSANADATPEVETARQSEVMSEHFALADAECNFYHYVVEGNVARDSIKVLPEVRGLYYGLFFNAIFMILHFLLDLTPQNR